MKILIEIPNWLGDTIMCSPAIENLLCHYKKEDITLFGYGEHVEIYKFHPRINDILIFEKKFLELIKFSKKNHSKFDLFISFRSSLRTKFFKKIIGCRESFQYDKNSYSSGHQVEKYNFFINSIIGQITEPGKLKIYR